MNREAKVRNLTLLMTILLLASCAGPQAGNQDRGTYDCKKIDPFERFC